MEFGLSILLVSAFLPAVLAQNISYTQIIIDGTTIVTETDENFICATIDWWPHDKCNYNHCPWGYSSVLNLDLSHPLLTRAIQAFKPLRIRIGGTLQDRVLYDVGSLDSPCYPFQKMKSGLFGFSRGCLLMSRWDELNQLFSKTGAIVTFGLNALHGRHNIQKTAWGGDWDSSNARDFINYTLSKGYIIDSWEFGNELSGAGINAHVDVESYGKDLIKLQGVLDDLYKSSQTKPLLIAPGGFFEQDWYTKLLQISGSGVVNIITYHIYNLGAGVDHNLVRKILDPHYLSKVSELFSQVDLTIRTHGPWASGWVSESGGAYNNGGRNVSNTFINTFWYLDQLGLASKYSTKVYCRQTLVGGYYGLLNTTTFVPNPDYYSALLWHRLMGKGVLPIGSDDALSFLRSYAHCSKGRTGVTLLLINLSNQTNFIVHVRNSMNINIGTANENKNQQESPFIRGIKKTVAWVGDKTSSSKTYREEYHLTPKDGNLRSQIAVLNGVPLEISNGGELPSLEPVLNEVHSPIYLSSLSVAFIVLPNFDAPACV